MKHSSLVVFLACSFLTIVVSEASSRFLAQVWQSEDGLPSNTVTSIAQATDGYLWVGTPEGLVRFDGVRFLGFSIGSGSALARMPVRALFPLSNGEVWITTARHTLLQGRGARLKEVPLPVNTDPSRASLIRQVVSGDKGEIFIVRGEDVWQFVDGKITPIAERTSALDKLLQQDAAAEPQRGRVMEGTSRPVLQLRGPRGKLWQFTEGVGLTLTGASGKIEPVSLQTESPSIVRAMFEDREGNLWMGTYTQGLWRVRHSRVQVLTKAEGLSDQATRSVLEDHAGALWVATEASGVNCLSAGVVKHLEIGPSRERVPIAALLETRQGVLWAATRDSRVYSLKSERFVVFSSGGGPTRVATMAEDERSRIWFGGRSGLSVWDGESRRRINLGRRESITAVISAGSTIWAGTESGRVFRGTGERFEAAGAADAFARQPISSLHADADGSLWVGTMGGGLFHLREGRVLALAPRMSEVDLRITCVLDDGAGFLWLGTMGGICRAEKATLLGASSLAPGSILVLDRSDGLLTRECSRGQPAGWRGRDGTLYFATRNGLVLVHPERLMLNTVPPPVLIEGASVDGRPVALAAGVQGGPGRSRLEFRYTALNFTAPEKVRFRTRLEGLDATWNDTGHQRTVAYEAVPPGSYRFRVMAENGDGVWNETGATLAVEVLPYFWETRWFQLGAALTAAGLAVGVGALIMRARMRGQLLRLQAQSARDAERARIAQDLHDELGASLTRIALMSDLAVFEPPSDDGAGKRFGEIGKAARSVSGTLDEIVWAMNPRNDVMERLVGYLGEFAAEYLESAGIPLNLELQPQVPPIPVSFDVRHQVLLGVKESLNNVVKYAGADVVTVRATYANGELEVVIADDGCGFDPAAVSPYSNGLRNMQQRLAALGGSAQIESCPGAGTAVTFRIPLS